MVRHRARVQRSERQAASATRYDGGDIVLGDSGQVIRPAESAPSCSITSGTKLITTDGTTLLGADDKSGIAEIMAAARVPRRAPGGAARAGEGRPFNPDEEIGRGGDPLPPVDTFGAVAAYTVDGSLPARCNRRRSSARRCE